MVELHISKIHETERRIATASGKCKKDIIKHLARLKRELRVYRSFRRNNGTQQGTNFENMNSLLTTIQQCQNDIQCIYKRGSMSECSQMGKN